MKCGHDHNSLSSKTFHECNTEFNFYIKFTPKSVYSRIFICLVGQIGKYFET